MQFVKSLILVGCILVATEYSIRGSVGHIPMAIKISTADSFGIPMPIKRFDSLVNALLVKFQSDDQPKSIDDYLYLVRVANTVSFTHLIEKGGKYYDIRMLFLKKYLQKTLEITEAKPAGLSFYSEKYDLLIGGKETANNFYHLIY